MEFLAPLWLTTLSFVFFNSEAPNATFLECSYELKSIYFFDKSFFKFQKLGLFSNNLALLNLCKSSQFNIMAANFSAHPSLMGNFFPRKVTINLSKILK